MISDATGYATTTIRTNMAEVRALFERGSDQQIAGDEYEGFFLESK